MNKFNAVICRYHEIAIKGANRSMFEQKMINNLKYLLRNITDTKIKRTRGRIWIQHSDNSAFTDEELLELHEQMKKAFGLESYSPVIMCTPDITELEQAVAGSCREYFDALFEKQKVVSFRIRARRSDKNFPMRSKEVEIALAKIVGSNYDYDSLNINLEDDADVTVGCEIREEFAFIFYGSYRCPGGLPVGSNSPVMALLSGGIDSPVACYMLMRRGCHVDYITFNSDPYTPPETTDKVRRMGEKLNEFQQPGKLYSCNLAEIQKLIRDNCRPEFRTVLYRRMMLRISQMIAKRNGNLALLTGDSVGQVASQTIINMSTIDAATDMLVLRPLVGIDKNETITMAREIGTFDISNEQVPDSCTVFAPKSPSTRAPLDRVIAEEERMENWQEVIEQIVENAVIY